MLVIVFKKQPLTASAVRNNYLLVMKTTLYQLDLISTKKYEHD